MGSITVERRPGLDVACPDNLPATGQEQLTGGDDTGIVLEVQDEGVQVEDDTRTINFTGDGVTASLTSDGIVEVNVPGVAAASLTVKEEGTTVDSAVSSINFVGTAVTATQTAAGAVQVAVVANNYSLTVKEEGSNVDTAVTSVDFVGSGVTATQTAPGAVQVAVANPTEAYVVVCSDETTALTTGTAKVTFRMPYAFTVTAVRASVTTAPTGSTLVVDINESGTTILSTKLSIDASEKTSTTAATAAVISDSSLADDAEMTIDIDQVGSTIAGAGLKVTIIGHRT